MKVYVPTLVLFLMGLCCSCRSESIDLPAGAVHVASGGKEPAAEWDNEIDL